MASEEATNTNDLVIMVMNTDNGEKHEAGRTEIVERFLNQEDLTPDFFLLQEVKVKKFEKVLIKKNYSKIEVNEVQNSYNLIMFKKELQGTQIEELTTTGGRYCAGQFTFRGKKILLVSFHGNNELDARGKELKTDQRFSRIKGENGSKQTRAIKQFRLGEYLEEFHKLKVDNQCDHLIVGGDFNLDMNKLLDVITIKRKTKKNGRKDLRERQEEFTSLFNSLNLKIVPYTHQREGQKNKVDALICDKDLSNDIRVTVYCNKYDGTVEDTSIKNFPFSQNTLDHHPLLFTIKITAPPTVVPIPTAEDQSPSTGVQIAPTGVLVAPTGVQVSPTVVPIPTAEDQSPSTGVQIAPTGVLVATAGVQDATAEAQNPPTLEIAPSEDDLAERVGGININDQET
jgi:hypothetical protein